MEMFDLSPILIYLKYWNGEIHVDTTTRENGKSCI